MNLELNRKNIKLSKQLGIGEFGPIYDAEVQLGVNLMSRAAVKVSLHGQTGSGWFMGMNLLVQNHNHYTTAKVRDAGERNRGHDRLISQKQYCTELLLFLFSLCHMVELVHEPYTPPLCSPYYLIIK